jgi:hypothetical protein
MPGNCLKDYTTTIHSWWGDTPSHMRKPSFPIKYQNVQPKIMLQGADLFGVHIEFDARCNTLLI